jgi:type II secretory pathway pseudopilin PulG
MFQRKNKADGFLITELIVGIALLGLILAGLGLTASGLTRFNRYQWARQQCLAAAQAQLDSLTATGRPLDDPNVARLWPEVTLTTDRTPGEGQWAGLELLKVTATANTRPRQTAVQLARYVRSSLPSEQGE